MLPHDCTHQHMPITPFDIQIWHPQPLLHLNSMAGQHLAFCVQRVSSRRAGGIFLNLSICQLHISPAGICEVSLKGGSANPPPPSHSPTSTTAYDVIKGHGRSKHQKAQTAVIRKLRCSRKFHTPVDAVDLIFPRYLSPALFIFTNKYCSTVCLSGRCPHPAHLGNDFGCVIYFR